MAELDRGRVAAVLTADTQMDIRIGLAALKDGADEMIHENDIEPVKAA